MSILRTKRDPEVMTQCAKSKVVWWGQRLVLMHQPKGSLMSAKNPWVGREKATNSRKPSCEKWGVELGVVGDQLSDLVGASVGRQHVNGGMSAKKRRELFASIQLGNGFPVPDHFRVVSLAETGLANLSPVEAELDLDGFQFAKIGVDGDGG